MIAGSDKTCDRFNKIGILNDTVKFSEFDYINTDEWLKEKKINDIIIYYNTIGVYGNYNIDRGKKVLEDKFLLLLHKFCLQYENNSIIND